MWGCRSRAVEPRRAALILRQAILRRGTDESLTEFVREYEGKVRCEIAI
jgi:hypothetical protein